MKITKVLGDNKYEVRIEPINTKTHPLNFGVAHDYVLFSAWTYLFCDDNTRIKTEFGGSTNILPMPTSVQIPIHAMGEVVLPKLVENDYLKEEHYSNYKMWSDDTVISNWSDSKTVSIYDKGQKKFIEISRELYEALQTKSK